MKKRIGYIIYAIISLLILLIIWNGTGNVILQLKSYVLYMVNLNRIVDSIYSMGIILDVQNAQMIKEPNLKL